MAAVRASAGDLAAADRGACWAAVPCCYAWPAMPLMPCAMPQAWPEASAAGPKPHSPKGRASKKEQPQPEEEEQPEADQEKPKHNQAALDRATRRRLLQRQRKKEGKAMAAMAALQAEEAEATTMRREETDGSSTTATETSPRYLKKSCWSWSDMSEAVESPMACLPLRVSAAQAQDSESTSGASGCAEIEEISAERVPAVAPRMRSEVTKTVPVCAVPYVEQLRERAKVLMTDALVLKQRKAEDALALKQRKAEEARRAKADAALQADIPVVHTFVHYRVPAAAQARKRSASV